MHEDKQIKIHKTAIDRIIEYKRRKRPTNVQTKFFARWNQSRDAEFYSS